MKHLTIFAFVLLLIFTSCKKDYTNDSYSQIRASAWNILSAEEKKSVKGEWQESIVNETTYMDKNAFSVTFHTSDEQLLGPIIVYLDVNSRAVIGKGMRF